ncbi:MAG: ferrochelatase, partial [Chloroflexi bacterium]|nr:ferrochelatase [Chloroflexota bacterium]
PALVAEYKRRYALIGGRSPLLEITQRQATALRRVLESRTGFAGPVAVGMRHWQPTIAEAVQQLAEQGVTHIVALCMTPHYSAMTVGAYRQKLAEAVAGLDRPLAYDLIESWHDHPGFIAALAEAAQESLARFSPAENPYVLFTAHSLPERIVAGGDPYAGQVRETAALVAAALELPAGRWESCFQSAAQRGGPWLGPQVEERVVALAEVGERALLVVPVGFVAEHIEVLYDIDIRCRQRLAPYNVHLERTPMMNDRDDFIAAMAEAVLGTWIGGDEQGCRGAEEKGRELAAKTKMARRTTAMDGRRHIERRACQRDT